MRCPCAGAEPADAEGAQNGTSAVDDDVNAEDDEAPEEDALAEPALVPPQAAAKVTPRRDASSSLAFTGKPLRSAGGKSFYRRAPTQRPDFCVIGDSHA